MSKITIKRPRTLIVARARRRGELPTSVLGATFCSEWMLWDESQRSGLTWQRF